MKIKSLTIYCSASQIIDKKFLKIAKETAEIISNYKIRVVYGDIVYNKGSTPEYDYPIYRIDYRCKK